MTHALLDWSRSSPLKAVASFATNSSGLLVCKRGTKYISTVQWPIAKNVVGGTDR